MLSAGEGGVHYSSEEFVELIGGKGRDGEMNSSVWWRPSAGIRPLSGGPEKPVNQPEQLPLGLCALVRCESWLPFTPL